jgi:adenosylmethionine-8-amino-7-oxononanoate aminotransferase
MTMAKGLTSGYAPMGAVMMTEAVYEGLAAGSTEIPLGHGFTYSGHPVSAAIALEVIRLYTEGGVLANAEAVAPVFTDGLRRLEAHPMVGEGRGLGLLGAIEPVADKATKRPFPKELRLSERLFTRAYDNGVIFRAFSDGVIGLAPALCCSPSEMQEIFARITKTLDDLLEEPDIRGAMG